MAQPLFCEGVLGEILNFASFACDRPRSPFLTMRSPAVPGAEVGYWCHCVCTSPVVSGLSWSSNYAQICISTTHCCRSMTVRCLTQARARIAPACSSVHEMPFQKFKKYKIPKLTKITRYQVQGFPRDRFLSSGPHTAGLSYNTPLQCRCASNSSPIISRERQVCYTRSDSRDRCCNLVIYQVPSTSGTAVLHTRLPSNLSSACAALSQLFWHSLV